MRGGVNFMRMPNVRIVCEAGESFTRSLRGMHGQACAASRLGRGEPSKRVKN